MRTRTLLACATLALLTVAWSAPTALAEGNNDGSGTQHNGAQPLSSSLPGPGHPVGTTAHDTNPIQNGPTEPTSPPPPPKPSVIQRPGPSPSPSPRLGTITPGPIPAEPKASLSLSPSVVRPGDAISANAQCANSQVQSLAGGPVSWSGSSGTVSPSAPDGSYTVTLVCVNGTKRDSASASFAVRRGPGGPGAPGGPGGPGNNLRASLSVSPKTVRQGEVVYFDGGCDNGQQVSLTADDVQVRGDRGYVDDDARVGDHTATRVCSDGHRQASATDHFQVVPGDLGPGNRQGPWDFWLSDRGGFRGDAVDASVRCRDNAARLESDALQDITLRRDGSRLTGTTRVVDRVSNGWHRVTVSCDGRSESLGFWVLPDRGDQDRWLSLSPGYGHRGDEIDVHVGCAAPVGRVESDALDDIDLDRGARPWLYGGVTHVSGGASPGEHSVRVRCGNDTLQQSFFVQGDADHGGDNGDQAGGDQVSVYPVGAPETGGGPVDGGPLDGGSGVWSLAALGLTALTGLMVGAGMPPARRKAGR